jgi:hypothetical protein
MLQNDKKIRHEDFDDPTRKFVYAGKDLKDKSLIENYVRDGSTLHLVTTMQNSSKLWRYWKESFGKHDFIIEKKRNVENVEKKEEMIYPLQHPKILIHGNAQSIEMFHFIYKPKNTKPMSSEKPKPKKTKSMSSEKPNEASNPRGRPPMSCKKLNEKIDARVTIQGKTTMRKKCTVRENHQSKPCKLNNLGECVSPKKNN